MTTDFSITRIRTRTDYDGDYDMENGKFFQFFQGIQQLFIQMDGGGSSWNEAVLWTRAMIMPTVETRLEMAAQWETKGKKRRTE